MQVAAAEFERGLISVRTREGMAQRKPEVVTFSRVVSADLLPTYRRVLALPAGGASLNAIARTLDEESVPTAKGGTCHASTVRAILPSATAKSLAASK